MNNYIIVLMLLAMNTYANKNWIKLDSTDDKIQNKTDLKMYTPQSTFKSIKQANQSNIIKNTNNSDNDLINIIKKIYDAKQEIESKIKSNK